MKKIEKNILTCVINGRTAILIIIIIILILVFIEIMVGSKLFLIGKTIKIFQNLYMDHMKNLISVI